MKIYLFYIEISINFFDKNILKVTGQVKLFFDLVKTFLIANLTIFLQL